MRAEKEKTMQAFKTLYLHPWYSKNVFNELSITNLTLSYERAKDDLSEITRLYRITPKNRKFVLFGLKEAADGRELNTDDVEEFSVIRE
jgi:hypothetical protein